MERQKYQLYKFATFSELIYSFVTSTRNLEDCISIMVERYGHEKFMWTMYLVEGDSKTEVYRHFINKNRKYRKVFDRQTEEIYASCSEAATKSGLTKNTVYKNVSPSRKMKSRFVYLENLTTQEKNLLKTILN